MIAKCEHSLLNPSTHFHWIIFLWCRCNFFDCEDVTHINPFHVNYSQDAAWQRLDWEKFMNRSFTGLMMTLIDDWQMKHKETSERQRANVLRLVPIPSAPQPYSSTSLLLSLSPYVYESVTMATSPQGQRRRGLLSFRQISIAGLIYDGLFRDYNTDKRSKWTFGHKSLFESWSLFTRLYTASC